MLGRRFYNKTLSTSVHSTLSQLNIWVCLHYFDTTVLFKQGKKNTSDMTKKWNYI